MRKVAVVWGTHPNENDALEVGMSLVESPIANVHPIVANKWAVRKKVRLIRKNMALAYPGNRHSPCYEERQAARVMKQIEYLNPDITSDIHSITGGKTHAVINTAMGVAPTVLGALKSLGVKYIVTNELNVHSHVQNSFGLEIASSEIERRGIGFVRDFFNSLANEPDLPTANVTDFLWFKYSEIGGGGLHESIIHPNDLILEEREAFGSFRPLPLRIQDLLGASGELYPQSDLSLPNEQGYFTDLLERTVAPDSSNWPR